MQEIKSSCFRLTSHLQNPRKTFQWEKEKKVFSTSGKCFGAESQSEYVHLHILCRVNYRPNSALENIGAACLQMIQLGPGWSAELRCSTVVENEGVFKNVRVF